MKVFILAIDGLEYTLVSKWRLRNLQQQQKLYGRLDVSNFKHVLTPIIWASFITGVSPETHGVNSWWTFSSNSTLNSLFHWVRYNVPIIKGTSQGKLRRILGHVGLNVSVPMMNDLKRKGLTTIFDLASKPVVIDVPSYNENPETRARYSIAMDHGVKAYENELWKVHKERVGRIMDRLDNEWDLFMAWLDLVDQIGHIYFGNNQKMLKAYTRLDTLARTIGQNLPDDTLLLIVSDHGMQLSTDGYPEHSNHAFYSFNMDVGWCPQSILDYANFIRKLLKINNAKGANTA